MIAEPDTKRHVQEAAVRYLAPGLEGPRFDVCAEALKWLGVEEEPIGSNRGHMIEQFFPPWQMRALERRDAQVGRTVVGPAWCAYYVTSMWHRALRRHPLGAQVGSCHQMAVRASVRGLWMPLDAEADLVFGPAPGDAFILLDRPFRRDDPCQGHTGLILRVSEDGREFVTLEGNSGQRVRIGQRRIDEPRMRGVISVLGDCGGTGWQRGLGDVQSEATRELGTR